MNRRVGGAFLLAAGLSLLTLAAPPGHARTRRSGRARRRGGYDVEIAWFEAVMDRFYRGETVDEARERHNALIQKHNEWVASKNGHTKAAEKRLDRELAPLRKLQADVDKMDGQLKIKPGASDRGALLRYNALVDRRNARVRQANELSRALKPEIDAYNGLLERTKAEVTSASERLDAARKRLDARVDEYEEFHEAERDLKFFRSLNRFYAGLHDERRSGGKRGRLSGKRTGTELDRAIKKVRGLRRELGVWAMRDHESREYGLVVIEAALGGSGARGGEPCFFIVDTGAMRTTVEPGLVAALGVRLGEETEFTLAGGEKVKGRKIVLPSVTVGKVKEKDVEAAAVEASEAGVDGLLGQTFLKRFIYAIDESRPGKLILRRRKN